MKKEDLYNIVANVFEMDVSEVSENSSQDNIEKWDSMGMINLVTELETELGIEFDLAEMAVMKNIKIIQEIVNEKLNG